MYLGTQVCVKLTDIYLFLRYAIPLHTPIQRMDWSTVQLNLDSLHSSNTLYNHISTSQIYNTLTHSLHLTTYIAV